MTDAQDYDIEEYDELDDERECGECCSHYDEINRCCWLVTEKGICIHVSPGDACHHGLKSDY
jgi:hypothetical protein